MKKFLFLAVQIIAILIFLLFLIANSFIISFEIKDFIYSFSSSYLFILVILIFVIIFFIQSLYFKSRFAFSNFLMLKKNSQKEKGYNSFVNGMLALANKDYKKASIESKLVSNYLKGDPSLSMLLKSEVLKVNKNYSELNILYEEMTKSKSMENLGYRGLMEQYLSSQDYHHAFIYGEKLFNNNPFIEKIYDTLVNIIVKTNNWQQLVFLTDKAYEKKIIDKKIFQENKSIAFYEIARIKRLSDSVEAINYIEKAISLRKSFPPYINLYLDMLIEEKKYFYVKKYLKKTWNDNAHPEYRSIFIKLSESMGVKINEITDFVIGSYNQNEETKILSVLSAIYDKEWDQARNNIKSLLGPQPTQEVCLLMARIEQEESNDLQKYNSWMFRSKSGLVSHMWVCSVSDKPQSKWSTISSSGYFNSLVWKKSMATNIPII